MPRIFDAILVLSFAFALAIPDNEPTLNRKVCDVCRCTVNIVDCSNRNLTSNLDDHEWPSTPLELITFENNQIAKIKPFTSNVVVKAIKLCHNKIDMIEHHAFKWTYNLTELDLSHNLLTAENLMPYAFEGRFQLDAYAPLKKLQVLNLSNNLLHSINRDLFEHTKDLRTLILSNNPLEGIDVPVMYSFAELPYLEELHLSNCSLKKVDEAILHSFRFLKKLNISYNNFFVLPDALSQTKPLEVLIMDGNPIELLNEANEFPLMPNLKELQMNNMTRLLAIDKGSLSNLENLEILSIENCPLLEEIDDEALAKKQEQGTTTWPPLKKLYLSNNALRYLPASLVARWDKLEELRITNNQWSCDCDNQYLISTLLVEQGKRLMGTNVIASLTCSAPPEHRNRTLMSLSNRKLRCLDYYGARPERDAAVLVGMLLGVLLAVPVVLVIFIFWKRGFFFCGRQGPASFSRAFYKRAEPCDYDI
ncbi:leucine-rich repeat neuronal protein 1 [Phymastichus coffea]|uniref:leucine-rich repeat neuronal protein 1 n=1 Tax=Phymastichus coffea TaxID=108790 RepID=UPI00273BE96F|nr:leucine-rich repeat neuronal protein 1 [Phymastichus coffea]